MLRQFKYRSAGLYMVIAALCLYAPTLSAQDLQYPAFTIPDSLKSDATAVTRLYTEEFVQSDLENAMYKTTYVVTILNKMGDRFANFIIGCDKFHDLHDFNGIVRDAMGKVIKKIKKGDLTNSSIDFESMATDNYSLSYTYQSPSYPFTVEYSWQMRFKNGILGYPSFAPYDGTGIAIEKSSFRMEVPADVDLRYKENYSSNVTKNNIDNRTVYTVSMEGAKAIANETSMPPSYESYPSVLFAPNTFCYDAHCGDMSTWRNYGLWVAELLKDRDALPDNEVTKLKEMTANAKTDREKVKIVYEYMQDNTRYVSIQLGIGGFQPFPAESVSRLRYGDCKGLSNLLKAMLKAVGISSNYCEIYSGNRKKIDRNFPSISQTNHAILLVPLKNDSIWLECTNQTLPFGYVHENISGHDAIVIAEDGSGGKVCSLPIFSSDQNKATTFLNIQLQENGTATGFVEFDNSAHQYRMLSYYINTKDRDKQLKYINDKIKLPKMVVGNISSSENFDNIPSSKMKADFVAEGYANKTGMRLFIPICPLSDRNYTYFSSDKRVFDIDINDGSTKVDSIIIAIPAGYAIESLPKETNLETEFGRYISHTSQDENTITYVQQITIPSGRYDKSKYKDIKDFLAKITTASKRKVVLKKE